MPDQSVQETLIRDVGVVKPVPTIPVNRLWYQDPKLRNVILLGISFMGLFSAFQTCGMIQTIVLQTYFGPDASTLGYISLAILYATLGVANWFSPWVVSLLGPKWGIVLGGLSYSAFIAVFLKPFYGTVYGGSVLVGLGAAVLWTAQGEFLTINSDKDTMARNSGLFWALFQSSYVWGNLFYFLYLGGSDKIEDHTRTVIFTTLLVISLVGIAVMFLFKVPVSVPAEPSLHTNEETLEPPSRRPNPWTAIVKSLRMLSGRDMLLLSLTFAYTGFEQTFYSGVYGTCLGYTTSFGEIRKSIVGLSGVFLGLGEVAGGLAFGILGKKTIHHGRDPIVLFGLLLHLSTFFLIFVNIPFDAPLGESTLSAFITPNVYLAIFCCFLLGLGDASFNTQVYSILGRIYSKDSASAFALFKFVQSICAAGGFFYSSYLFLQYQLLILVIMGVIGTFSFCFVEWRHSADHSDDKD